MEVCPICFKDRDVPHELLEAIVIGEYVNPGGRQIMFKEAEGKWLQLHDQCSSCDNKRIKEFLDQVRAHWSGRYHEVV